VLGVAVVRARRHDDVHLLVCGELPRRRRQLLLRPRPELLLRLRPVIVTVERQRRVVEPQLPARPPTRALDLLAPPRRLSGPSEAAGEVDDPVTGIAEPQQRAGGADGLVIRMGGEMQDGQWRHRGRRESAGRDTYMVGPGRL